MKTFFVDAFTNRMFRGNPAAVCVVDNVLPESTMQDIAAEIGFSETAFIRPLAGNRYGIRFFTPKKEIALCGHATLAASKIIFQTSGFADIEFLNNEGTRLFVERSGNAIRMEFPVYGTEDIVAPPSLLHALGIRQINASVYNRELNIMVLETVDTETLGAMRPDFGGLVRSYTGINGVLVTAKADGTQFDFHYRYFWPWTGTDEDPATGAVQTFLTRYWSDQLGKTTLRAFQSSGRTAMMNTVLMGDKVFIYGEAVIVLEGNLKIV